MQREGRKGQRIETPQKNRKIKNQKSKIKNKTPTFCNIFYVSLIAKAPVMQELSSAANSLIAGGSCQAGPTLGRG